MAVAGEKPMAVDTEVADLLDRVMGSTHRTEPVAARVKVRLEDRLENQLELACTSRSRAVGIPRRRSLPDALGIIRSRTGSGENRRALRSSRSSRRNASPLTMNSQQPAAEDGGASLRSAQPPQTSRPAANTPRAESSAWSGGYVTHRSTGDPVLADPRDGGLSSCVRRLVLDGD